ncbi:MAG: hypothetical protein HOI23_23685 [Deltaproteobacteria bacterium]|nr:hypothetical protein [Deltaproteobacteria bacterium]MBT6433716.1 hypothetical protein [Deltaproteobacteria bacterium]
MMYKKLKTSRSFWTLGAMITALLFGQMASAAKYDYKASGIEHRILEETGIELFDGYRARRCILASKDDHCLPTGYVEAVENGGVYITLWEIEVLLMQERDAEADRMLRKVQQEHPKMSKPLWLLAKNLFFKAEHLPEGAVEERRQVLEEGTQWAKKCVELAPGDINCQLHLGVTLARWSTNNGIIKSVFNGPAVSAAWDKAIKLKTHYRFPSANTSWGAANYGMGIFNRLVPDSWWFNLFFGFRGSIDRSINFLRAAGATKDDQVELYTELSAAYYCKWSREESEWARREGDKAVKACLSIKPPDRISEISQDHCRKLKASPKISCGYSRDRQQETDIERFREEAEN